MQICRLASSISGNISFQVHLSSSSSYLGSGKPGVLIFTPPSASTKTSDKNPPDSAVSLNSRSPLKCHFGYPDNLELMVVSARGLRLCGIIGVIVFLQTCWNGECSGSSWAKTLKLIEPTARHVDVRAQKPREPFGRRCYLRINSATAIRSANASSVHCLSANVSKMSPFHVHQSSCSQSHALCPKRQFYFSDVAQKT